MKHWCGDMLVIAEGCVGDEVCAVRNGACAGRLGYLRFNSPHNQSGIPLLARNLNEQSRELVFLVPNDVTSHLTDEKVDSSNCA